jgi:putative toxin-antitoxin system antitoxin component (TIGR02293 family)
MPKKHSSTNPYAMPGLSKLDMINTIKSGLPSNSIRLVEKRLGLTRTRLAQALSIPERTLSRRLRQSRLTSIESDRLDRLMRIFEVAADVLGSELKARSWLGEPNRALGSAIPLEMLATERGAREVEDVLGRIDWGDLS